MPATSVIALLGPGVPTKGMPRSRARGFFAAVMINPDDEERRLRSGLGLPGQNFRHVDALDARDAIDLAKDTIAVPQVEVRRLEVGGVERGVAATARPRFVLRHLQDPRAQAVAAQI